MRAAGKTRRKIAAAIGSAEKQIKNWVTRHNHEPAKAAAGIALRSKGRPRKNAERVETELKRLRMKNQQLRDFLQ